MSKRLTNNPNAKELYYAYKGSAKRRKIEFDVSMEDFLAITQHECYMCGQLPASLYLHHAKRKRYTEAPKFRYNGIDRADNTMGYIRGNMVACCGRCNIMKHKMTVEQFLTQIVKIYRNVFEEMK